MQHIDKPPRTFFPTAINTYRQCPQRFLLQYVRKVRRPLPFSAALVKGGATHRLLARHVVPYLRSGNLPDRLLAEARQEIEGANYPPHERQHMARDAEEIVNLTVAGLQMLEPGAQPLLVERNLFALLGRGPVELGARVDLVVQHEDATVEHIDFKTGKRRPDDRLQMLISRVVVGRRMAAAPRIQTTLLYLQQRQADSRELAGPEFLADWQALKATITEIRTTTSWPPVPGPLCDYCPYKDRDCAAW